MDSWILTSPSEKTSKQTVAPFPSTCLAQLRRQDSLPETSVRAALLLPWTAWYAWYDLDSLATPGVPSYALHYLAMPWTASRFFDCLAVP